MKNFKRDDTSFSLCGLNCSLCPMHIDRYCPGCGGGPGNQSCAIARCSKEHGGLEYCHQCGEYPCEKYVGIDQYDSFVSHRNQLKDMDRIRQTGSDAYLSELKLRAEILHHLLENFNDGRKKSLYCIAVNLLDFADLISVMEKIKAVTDTEGLPVKEKAAIASALFQSAAEQRGIELKLRKR